MVTLSVVQGGCYVQALPLSSMRMISCIVLTVLATVDGTEVYKMIFGCL